VVVIGCLYIVFSGVGVLLFIWFLNVLWVQHADRESLESRCWFVGQDTSDPVCTTVTLSQQNGHLVPRLS
jgi:hypothetical protein